MKYIVLVYPDEKAVLELPQEAFNDLMARSLEVVERLDQSGKHIISARLASPRSASTLKRRNGHLTVTDGPFSETKEFLGGFTIFEATDLNEAIQTVSQIPVLQCASFEVRPVLDDDEFKPVDAYDTAILQSLVKDAGGYS